MNLIVALLFLLVSYFLCIHTYRASFMYLLYVCNYAILYDTHKIPISNFIWRIQWGEYKINTTNTLKDNSMYIICNQKMPYMVKLTVT